MKVGIVTFHFVNNFGGALQAYALRRSVEESCGVYTELIDYRNWFIRLCDWIRLLPMTTNIQEIKTGIASMRDRIARRNRFGLFTKDYNRLSRKYINHWQLNLHPPGDDKYICGSDQVWNPYITMGISSSYFLCFEKNPQNRIAYAPSFGTDRIGRLAEKRIGNNIKDFAFLSAREKTGQELIRKMTGRESERLIDPTFLLEKSEWEKIGRNPLHSGEPYILLYIMQRDEDIYTYVKKIKENMGMRIVEISRYGYQPGYIDEILVDIGPLEFLGLFRDASFICTNSYHGLAYSVIFEKDFFLMKCKRFSARINNLLDMLKIDASLDDSEQATLSADYDKEYIRNTISEERNKAIAYLQRSLGVTF